MTYTIQTRLGHTIKTSKLAREKKAYVLSEARRLKTLMPEATVVVYRLIQSRNVEKPILVLEAA